MPKITLYASDSEKPEIDKLQKKLKEPLSKWFVKAVIRELNLMNAPKIDVVMAEPSPPTNTAPKLSEEEKSVLVKIAKAAEKLNTQANEATRYIEEVEKRLNEAHVGREIWLDSPGMHVTEKPLKLKMIGFAKIEGIWGIAVKPPTQLVTTSDRATRIAAAPLIPKLLELLAETITT